MDNNKNNNDNRKPPPISSPSPSPSSMEDEKAAIRRALCQQQEEQSKFRQEKQGIVTALGGGPDMIQKCTPTTNLSAEKAAAAYRIQNNNSQNNNNNNNNNNDRSSGIRFHDDEEEKNDAFPHATTTSSRSMMSSTDNRSQSRFAIAGPNERASCDPLAPLDSALSSSINNMNNHDSFIFSSDPTGGEDQEEVPYYENNLHQPEPVQAGMGARKSRHEVSFGFCLLLLVTLGTIVVSMLIFLTISKQQGHFGNAAPSSTITATVTCIMDRNTLLKLSSCSNDDTTTSVTAANYRTMQAAPGCAQSTFQELLPFYPTLTTECEMAGLVALAVAQTNFHTYFLSTTSTSSSTSTTSPQQDLYLALAILYFSMDGIQWSRYHRNWLKGKSPIHWDGIQQEQTIQLQDALDSLQDDRKFVMDNHEKKKIVKMELSLNANHLKGRLLSSVFYLIHKATITTPATTTTTAQLPITRIQLGNNHEIVGSIPTEVGLLTTLTYLDLSRNIDDDDNNNNMDRVMSSTTSDNITSHPIPSELGMLTELQVLNLSGNTDLTGTIPTELGALIGLTTLNLLDISNLVGTIPTELCFLMTNNSSNTTGLLYTDCGNNITNDFNELGCLVNICES